MLVAQVKSLFFLDDHLVIKKYGKKAGQLQTDMNTVVVLCLVQLFSTWCADASAPTSIAPAQAYATASIAPAQDECDNYQFLSSANRSLNYGVSWPYRCDLNDLKKGWYRFTGAAGTQIATSCVPMNRCNAFAPGWMNGSHPTVQEGIVNRTVCYHYYYNYPRECCAWRNTTQVKNCGGFFIYLLGSTPTCYARYCGNGIVATTVLSGYVATTSDAEAIQPTATIQDYVYATTSIAPAQAVRLVGGTNPNEGRVEVFYNGRWGIVCDDFWDLVDANVVCRQLGLAPAVQAPCCTRFGSGSGQFFLDNVRCSGTERSLSQCPHNGLGNHNCGSGEVAGVVCGAVIQPTTTIQDYASATTSIAPAQGCSLSANIIFVLDESGSIGSINYQLEKDFVKKIIEGLNISAGNTQVGVVEYAGYATESIRLGQYSIKQALLSAVDALRFLGGGTATSLALTRAHDMLRNTQFQADRKMIIVLTDGHSNGGESVLKPVVEIIKRNITDLTMMAVGVGGYSRSELDLIATDPDKHVFTVSGFNQLLALTQQLLTTICEAPTSTQAPTTSQVQRICVDGKPCENGGTCITTYPWYLYCDCPYGFSGRRCENNLKVQVNCLERYMELVLKRQYFSNIDPREVHLNDPLCRASYNSSHIVIRTLLDGCRTNFTEYVDKIIFKNQAMIDFKYHNQTITRQKSILQSFHCEYARRQLVNNVIFDPSKEMMHASEGGFGNFTFTKHICKSSICRTVYLPFDYPIQVYLDEDIYVKFQVTNTIRELVVFAENCFATPSANPNSFPKYWYLRNGCIADPTMVYNYNQTSSEQRYSIKAFRFIKVNSQLVYLHCELMVCHRSSPNSRCSQGCIRSRRRRRDAGEYEDTSNLYDLSSGPITGQKIGETDQNEGSDGKVQGMAIGLGVLGGVLVVLLASAILKFISAKILRSRKVGSAPSYAVKGIDGPGDPQCDETLPEHADKAFEDPAAFKLDEIKKSHDLNI